MEQKEKIHLLIRYSDRLIQGINTIQEHRILLLKYNSVWFGKLGKTLAWNHVFKINEQCNNSISTYVFFLQRIKSRPVLFQASIIAISREFPKNENQLIPKYYFDKELINNINLWVKISSINDAPYDSLNHYRAISSPFPIKDTIKNSIAAMFVIKKTSVMGNK